MLHERAMQFLLGRQHVREPQQRLQRLQHLLQGLGLYMPVGSRSDLGTKASGPFELLCLGCAVCCSVVAISSLHLANSKTPCDAQIICRQAMRMGSAGGAGAATGCL